MIQIRQISSSLTEIYVGGKYLTESYPTNFHTFATRRTLTAGDDARITDEMFALAAERQITIAST